MLSVLIWLALAAFIFLSNHFHWLPFIGIRFTAKNPIGGGWLCVVLAVYCLVRFIMRRKKHSDENPDT